jgi:hypothetical protein
MKKNKFVTYGLALIIISSFTLQSCVKNDAPAVDASSNTPKVLILEGGLTSSNFNGAALSFPSSDATDTTYFHLNYAANTVAPKDVTVTIAYDAAALAAYNAAHPTFTYQKFPDSIYSFTTTTVTIKAGQSYSDVIPLTIFPSKVDGSQNYMFPISITDAQGNALSGNFNTIYYHMIGNIFAGNYTVYYSRWNSATPSGNPTTQKVYSGVSGSAVNANVFEIQSGYGTQGYGGDLRHRISFDGTSFANATNFIAKLNTADVTAFTGAGFTLVNDDALIRADASTKTFVISYSVLNPSGAGRCFIDSCVKE